MPRSATIQFLAVAFEMMKAMQDKGLGWGEDCRPLARRAIVSIIEDGLAASIDAHLLRVAERGEAHRRNGSYRRRVLTELGGIELSVPRTRTYSPAAVVRAYTRPTAEVDRMILACFVLGLSTRKVGEALLYTDRGRKVSSAAVSQVAKSLDAVVAAFHRRPLKNRYKVLMLDGVTCRGRPARAPSNARFWWFWACCPTAATRMSSTSASPGRRAPPNGSTFWMISTAAG